MTYLILIRHGDTRWTAEKRYQGQTDIPLSPNGKDQMQGLARLFKKITIDALYSSQLSRSKESADILAKSLKLKPVTDIRLNEVSFGRWEGKTAQELLKEGDPVYQKWAQGRWVTAPKGESIDSLKKRAGRFLKDCLRKHYGKKIVIVSHGGTIRMIVLAMLKLPLRYMFHFRIDPAAVTILKDYGNVSQLMCLNTREFAWIPRK